jgi:small subunit ribosomal protein S21
MEVKVVGGNLESAIQTLRRMIQKDGLIKELKTRSAYQKPSVKRKDKHRKAIRRLKKWKTRQENSVNGRSEHDYIKKINEANRLFNLRRAINPIWEESRRNQGNGCVSHNGSLEKT